MRSTRPLVAAVEELESRGLVRTLGLWDVTTITAGTMLGSAIFVAAAFVPREVPHPTLAVLHADARDYGLFRPRERFASEVIPWGSAPFDPQRMRRLIEEQGATHVLVQDDHCVLMNWGPHVETTEMVRWLTQQRDLREVDAVSPGMRLFVVWRPAEPDAVSPFPGPRRWLEWLR